METSHHVTTSRHHDITSRHITTSRHHITLDITLALITLVITLACGSGGGGGSSNDDITTESYHASDIILTPSNVTSRDKPRLKSGQIYASDVALSKDNNSIEATNLQEALDNDLKPKIRSLLKNSSWTITNIVSSNDIYTNGKVTFTDSSMNIGSGGLACFGMPNAGVASITSLQMYGSSYIAVTWERDYSGSTGTVTSIGFIIQSSKNKIIIAGDGGTGVQGVTKITILEKQ